MCQVLRERSDHLAVVWSSADGKGKSGARGVDVAQSERIAAMGENGFRHCKFESLEHETKREKDTGLIRLIREIRTLIWAVAGENGRDEIFIGAARGRLCRFFLIAASRQISACISLFLFCCCVDRCFDSSINKLRAGGNF